ncbi:NAD-dependent epimerase/dehydratase family protein [Phenylobacterium sp. LjRoot219]|uniref:NAD-dependent epimerase/dehydratase family protein n=1 Tax=Phenylobacterium sp. LjRoot219 TaxID=3342283 RepID=UPI003ECEA443
MNTRNLTQPRDLASGPTAGQAAADEDAGRAPTGRVVEVARRALGRPRNVCLVGAGNIAATHARVLQAMPGVRIAAVVDPDLAAARRLADSLGAGSVHDSATAAIRAEQLDAAHVMVPPQVHRDAAMPLLEAGCSVLLEKPLGTSRAECDELLAAARRTGATLGVNQNFVFHPAFARLRRALAAGTYGKPRFVDCIYNVQLRQLAARQFGHWMFHQPGNILLEQAVHPLSQIVAVAGAVRGLRAIAGPPTEIAPGVPLFPAVTATLDCAETPAQLRFAVGQSYPFWQLTVVCDDGVLVADILANRCYAHGRTRWLEAADGLISGVRTAGAVFGGAVRNASDYALSTLRLQRPSEPFLRSMQGSIGAFYEAIETGASYETDGRFGAALVSVCEAIRDEAFGAPAPAPAAAATPRRAARRAPAPDVAVLGGTGFIGAQTVQRFLAEGKRVSVLARSIRNLPAELQHEDVVLHRGDIRDYETVRSAIGDAGVVVNLAHGGGGASYEQVRAGMVGGAETVARISLALGVRRMLHIGSIAGLYLGPQGAPITGATPPDPLAWRRADYARAKAECDRMLLEMHAREGLPVCILRPGLVVGEGTAAFHSGLGFFNNDQHCVGWNLGRNALPFVLVQDVAEAIVLAALTDTAVEGRCYNLVGDVRPSAREYMQDLAEATGRPLRFHPSLPAGLWAGELAKWTIKRAGGRRSPLPSHRDILSRGLRAKFDCDDARRDLGWIPTVDPRTFARLAVAVHAR